MKKKAELIFIPSPGIGHLNSAIEFAQLLINRDNHLSITLLCIKLPSTPFSNSYIRSVIASHPQIQLIDLPYVEPPPQELLRSPAHYLCTFMDTLKPHVKITLQNFFSSHSNSGSNRVIGLVLDFVCATLIDVGKELGLPSYLFVPANAGFLSLMLYLQKRSFEDVFNDSDPQWLVPGVSTLVPTTVLPDSLINKYEKGFIAYYNTAKKFTEAKGFIVNTFSELEQYAIDALCDGQTPPIYAVGPLIDLKSHPNPNLDQAQHESILKWLDEQPPSSVVFLCFGSRGSLDASQTKEIALGLQRSGVRFLWALRSPPTTDNAERIFPEGFLEWMEGRGMVCGWAPQVEVLAHKAIGGFVSHCGWNSILESLWFGVPILTWPVYAEQQLNAFRMVRELGLAVELRRGSALVMAEEIEKGLKQLMEKDNMVHKKVQEVKEKARKAVLSGGSSFISVQKLIDNMIGRD